MRAYLEQVGLAQVQASLKVFTKHQLPKDSSWHFHPEIEFVLVLAGHGQALIGDSVGAYQTGDLFMTGRNLPHHYVTRETERVHFLIVQFNGRIFDHLPEFETIRQQLQLAQKGLLFSALPIAIRDRLIEMPSLQPTEALFALFEVMHACSSQPSLAVSSLSSATGSHFNRYQVRLQKVLDYINRNMASPISAKAIADQCAMTLPSFSRWFRQTLNTTFSDYLKICRMEQACHYLMTTDLPVNRIGPLVGYETLSHFNRTFKAAKQCSPLAYRKRAMHPD
ncbi:AraC family transcriptional regulator [Reinekea forsetii]|nr:AraC family transcriptional regulator [Reinekea forsetii]